MSSLRTIVVLSAAIAAGSITALPVGAEQSVLVIPAPDESSQRITTEQVRQVMQDIVAATEAKNVEGITRHMAPFIYSKISLRTPNGRENVVLNGVENHRRSIAEDFDGANSYKYLYTSLDVRVSPDGKTAFAEDTSLIDASFNDGRRALVSSAGITRFALVRGQLAIISSDGISEIEPTPTLGGMKPLPLTGKF